MFGEANVNAGSAAVGAAESTKPRSAAVVAEFHPYEIQGKKWGSELVIAQTDRYLGKCLRMKAGHSGPLQYHERKDEAFYLYSGRAIVRYHDAAGVLKVIVMHEGMAFHIPPGAVHQVEALTDCVFFETSTPVFEDRVAV